MPMQVVTGALLQCSFGVAPAPLAIAWALRVGAGYRKVKLARSMP